MVLQILFWVLLILSAIGYFVPLGSASALRMQGQGIVILILVAILGFSMFGK